MNLNVIILGFLGLLGLLGFGHGNKRPHFHKPLPVLGPSSSPCHTGASEIFDSVEEERSAKTLLLAAAVGYHIANKQKQPIIINNNIYGGSFPPCVGVQGISGTWATAGSGGGLLGGVLNNHPILSNVLQGGWLGGGGNGAAGNAAYSRPNGVNWNRAIRQFGRIIRPITRVFR